MLCRLLTTIIAATALALFMTACSVDFETGAQLPGQECTSDDHCASDLICVERRCRAVTGGGATDDDAGVDDVYVPDNHHQPDGGNGWPDVNGPQPICEPGERYCIDESTVSYCWLDERGDPLSPSEIIYSCGPNEYCDGGYCHIMDNDPQPPCVPGEAYCLDIDTIYECFIDEDGEVAENVFPCGSGFYCQGGTCREGSGPVDPDPCCEDGCGTGQICHECTCVDYNSQSCQYQNQPCQTEGQISGGYVCSNIGADSVHLRCIGLCSPNAANPNQTCPDADSVCSYETPNDPNGWCLSACHIGDYCADSRMACIYNNTSTKDGFCLPVSGLGQPGDSCDEQDPYSCADEHLCIGGTCRQSCRPFEQAQSDCPGGDHCLAFDPNLGVCLTDTSTPGGGCTQEFTTCGADATGCFANAFGGTPTCYEFCRLDLGDQDCTSGSCFQHDSNNDLIGMCL